MTRAATPNKIVALSGGVGGAKLALGLSRILAAGALTVVANVGDDFEHLGLSVSPDLDTLMYVLAGLDDAVRGWGRARETWTFLEAMDALGGETWFKLGDGDLATHVERTCRLHSGQPLSSITADFCRRLGIATAIVPATDDRLRTLVRTTNDGVLHFQDYFVRRKCEPIVTAIHFDGADTAQPNPAVLQALRSRDLAAVVICPSNPYISIDPILAISAIRQALLDCDAPIVAVSPIIGGKAVKGPTAKMMAELGSEVSAATVARHYDGLIDGYVLDEIDAASASSLGIATCTTRTLMVSVADREALGSQVLAFANSLREAP
jgi:LPPG:FO 2-phospho-L-lactate transferase